MGKLKLKKMTWQDQLEDWQNNEKYRLENNGWGICNTGINWERICEFGGIGCNVNHVLVKLRNST